jgi:hypothetical protein
LAGLFAGFLHGYTQLLPTFFTKKGGGWGDGEETAGGTPTEATGTVALPGKLRIGKKMARREKVESAVGCA